MIPFNKLFFSIINEHPIFPSYMCYSNDNDSAELLLPNFEKIFFRKELLWPLRMSAGGDLCACVSSSHVTPLTRGLHELAATERVFARKLCQILDVVLKPVLHSGNALI